MFNSTSFLIVAGTIALLMLIQYKLTRARHSRIPRNTQRADHGTTSSHEALLPGLSIIGLDSRGLSHLRQCILSRDPGEVAVFLAFNHCSFPELDAFLQNIRASLRAKRPRDGTQVNKITIKTIFDRSMIPTPPAGIRFETLSEDERLNILAFEPSEEPIVTRELLARFGGHNFPRVFAEYCQYKKPAILCIPIDDPRRSIFEKLVESGMAIQGRDISLEHRLTLLNQKQLQQMASDLNLKQHFPNKPAAVSALAKINGSRVLFSMQYVLDDLFYLQAINENEQYIQEEWGYLQAYAKLLLSTPDKVRLAEIKPLVS